MARMASIEKSKLSIHLPDKIVSVRLSHALQTSHALLRFICWGDIAERLLGLHQATGSVIRFDKDKVK